SRRRARLTFSISRSAISRTWVQNWGSSDASSPPARVVTNRRTAHPPIRRFGFRTGHRLDARRLEAGQRLPEQPGTAESLCARRYPGPRGRGAAAAPTDDHLTGESGTSGVDQTRVSNVRRPPAPT